MVPKESMLTASAKAWVPADPAANNKPVAEIATALTRSLQTERTAKDKKPWQTMTMQSPCDYSIRIVGQ
jgi:hypothetical protein